MHTPTLLACYLLATALAAALPSTVPPPPSSPPSPPPPDRMVLCVTISNLLTTVSCGANRAPCLSLAVQEEIYAKCKRWRKHTPSRGLRYDQAVEEEEEGKLLEEGGEEREMRMQWVLEDGGRSGWSLGVLGLVAMVAWVLGWGMGRWKCGEERGERKRERVRWRGCDGMAVEK